MGTDIRLLVEVSHDGKPWHILKGMGEIAHKGPRDYPLFAMLANVRNRSGEGGQYTKTEGYDQNGDLIEFPEPFIYDTDDGGILPITPISRPRGVPDDATLQWRANVAIWENTEGAEVITTWLDLEEILAADWTQMVTRDAIILEKDYLLLRDHGITPTTWSGGTNVPVVTAEEYEAGERREPETAVRAQWVAGTIEEVTSNFISALRQMEGLLRKTSSSKVRLMLLFES